MIKTIFVKVTGKVQGVGFRWCSYEKFVELGLTGSAENMPDGSIEITATGEVDSLKHFLRWAQQGPVGGKVEKMDYKTIESEGAGAESPEAQAET